MTNEELLEQAFLLKPNKPVEKKEVNAELNFKDIFRKKNCMNLVGVSVVMGGIYAEYGICIFINQKIGIDNIYLNGTLLGVVEVVGYILIFLFANKLGRKQINIYSNLYILIASLALVIMDLLHNEMSHGIKKALWFQTTETGEPGLSLCNQRNQFVHQARHMLPIWNNFQLRHRIVPHPHSGTRAGDFSVGGTDYVVSGVVHDIFH